MKNPTLVADHIRRSEARLAAIEVLYERKSWADVVRECQEVVELSLKALVRSAGIEVPRVHDVGDILLAHPERFPPGIRDKLKRLSGISRALRRDRELAFYGSEDLTPSEFYREADARKAKRDARWVFETVKSAV